MADVFVSYAREDRARAEQLARALQAEGLDVFWDTEIPPGQTWADYIEGKLAQCKALIVLWSEHSTKSQWVREEARMGRDKGILIPAMIDNSQAPFGFGEVQAANLATWRGQGDHAEWRRFLDAVKRLAGTSTSAPRAAAPQQTASPPRMQMPPIGAASAQMMQQARAQWKLVAGVVGGAVALLLLIGLANPARHGETPAVVPTGLETASAATPSGVSAPAQEQPTTEVSASPQDIILAQLQQAQGALGGQGYQQLGQPFSGGLQQGQTWNVPVDLYAGYEYRVIGVCDRDCNDLDLVLYDPNGQPVTQDTSVDDHPQVGTIPAVTGRFMLQVQMYHCAVAPCYYAVALYARQPT